jgi:hypothetical protein
MIFEIACKTSLLGEHGGREPAFLLSLGESLEMYVLKMGMRVEERYIFCGYSCFGS